jgi:hypothetical protein
VDQGNPRDQPTMANGKLTILQGTETRQDEGEKRKAPGASWDPARPKVSAPVLYRVCNRPLLDD